MAKLFIFCLIALASIAISEASTVLISFDDATCATATGFYANAESCNIPQKRAAEGFYCYQYSSKGPWYNVVQCNAETVQPNNVPPAGFQTLITSYTNDCNIVDGYAVTGTSSSAPTKVLAYSQSSLYVLNVTITCNANGVMDFESCVNGAGCTSFAAEYNTCSVPQIVPPGFTISGNQTSCMATPIAPPAAPVADTPMSTPMMSSPTTMTPSAPVATPSAAPQAATPLRKTSNASVTGSAVSLVAIITTVVALL